MISSHRSFNNRYLSIKLSWISVTLNITNTVSRQYKHQKTSSYLQILSENPIFFFLYMLVLLIRLISLALFGLYKQYFIEKCSSESKRMRHLNISRDRKSVFCSFFKNSSLKRTFSQPKMIVHDFLRYQSIRLAISFLKICIKSVYLEK